MGVLGRRVRPRLWPGVRGRWLGRFGGLWGNKSSPNGELARDCALPRGGSPSPAATRRHSRQVSLPSPRGRGGNGDFYMAFHLASDRDGRGSGFVKRFTPSLWTVNFPRPMRAGVVTPGPDGLGGIGRAHGGTPVTN